MANRRRMRGKTDPFADILLGKTVAPRQNLKRWMLVSSYDDPPIATDPLFNFVAFQRETAPVCGAHYQVYVECRSKQRGSAVVAALGLPVLQKGEA